MKRLNTDCNCLSLSLILSPGGGPAPLVVCADCYDNASMYSRTLNYCPYAYLGDDDPLDKTLPEPPEDFSEPPAAQSEDAALESLMSNLDDSSSADSSDFLTSQRMRLNGHAPPGHYANGEAACRPLEVIMADLLRCFWITC